MCIENESHRAIVVDDLRTEILRTKPETAAATLQHNQISILLKSLFKIHNSLIRNEIRCISILIEFPHRQRCAFSTKSTKYNHTISVANLNIFEHLKWNAHTHTQLSS